MSDITSRQFLTIMYNQLTSLKKEDEKYFNQALLCMDLGLNPKDLRIDEQISIEFANNYIEDKKNYDKKNFHFLSEDIINSYEKSKNDPQLQSAVIRQSNELDRKEDYLTHRNNDYER